MPRSWTQHLSLYTPHGERKYLNDAERSRALCAMTALPPERALFALTLAWTGARVSEVLALSASSFQIERYLVSIRTLKRRRSIVREVPIPPRLMAALDQHFELLRTQSDSCLAARPLWRWRRETAWRFIKDAMKQAGIVGRRACPRGLRHAFGIGTLHAGVPINLVQRWLGHARISTTAIAKQPTGRMASDQSSGRETPRPINAGNGRANEDEDARLFEFGRYWLGRESGSPCFYYYWYEPTNRNTKRRSTKLRDLEAAKRFLIELALDEGPTKSAHPDTVTFEAVRRFYFAQHVQATVNDRRQVRDKTGIRRAFDLVSRYQRRQLRLRGEAREATAADFTLVAQEGFIHWCRGRHKLSPKSISTYLSYIKAGFRFAATPQVVVDQQGLSREARVMSEAPYVFDSEAYIARITGLPRSRPRDWIPTDAELAATLSQCAGPEHEAVFRYIILALNTGARPEAICELSVDRQVDFQRGLVDMNPPDRPQNRKVRPLISLTDNLRGWLLHWKLDHPIVHFGRPVVAVSNRTLKKAARRAGVAQCSEFNRYTLRHYISTRIRRVDGPTIHREERARWLGHTDPNYRTTEQWYEDHDPDYLENVRRAIDTVMLRLNRLSRRPLIAPPSPLPSIDTLSSEDRHSNPGSARAMKLTS